MPWTLTRRRCGDGGTEQHLTIDGAGAPAQQHAAAAAAPPARPPPAAAVNVLEPGEPADAAAWSDAETHVRVDRVHGFLCKVSVHARVDLPPAGVFAILTQPDNSGVFRAIEAMPYRRVLAEGGRGPTATRSVEVEHVARWRAGPLLSGTLTTRLLVEEDAGAGTVSFRLAPGGPRGFMAAFEGAWTVAPFNQAALDGLLAGKGGGREGGEAAAAAAAAADAPRGAWALAGAALARLPAPPGGRGGGRAAAAALPASGASLVTLTQAVGPRVPLPPPLDRLVAAICARQVRGLLRDLRAEAARRRHRAAGQWRDEAGGGGGGGGGGGVAPPPPALGVVPAGRPAGGGGRGGRPLLW